MRKEHTSHVVMISLMLAVILIVFGFVLFHNPNEAGTRFTTSLSAYPVGPLGSMGVQALGTEKTATQTETEVLLAFLIIIAFLFAVWLVVKIVREVRGHVQGK